MIIEANREDIDLEYLAYQLAEAIAEGNFEYEAKLYNRVKQLSVTMPVVNENDFDIDLQRNISAAIKRFNTLRQKLHELGVWCADARIKG